MATRGALLTYLAMNSDGGSSPESMLSLPGRGSEMSHTLPASSAGTPLLELSPTQLHQTAPNSSYHTALASCGRSALTAGTADVERFSAAVAGAVGGAVEVRRSRNIQYSKEFLRSAPSDSFFQRAGRVEKPVR